MIKELLKKLALGKRYSSETYVNYLRSIGVKIGEDCVIYVPSKTLIDEQYPYMITIGSHVRITEGVKILTHDYSWMVLKNVNGHILGASGKVNIGNNVFIGMNTVICRNVNIGDNVIIGAGSIVTRDCESSGIYAGVPAKKIMNLSEYLDKRNKCQVQEAVNLAREYYKRYGRKPNKEVFSEYFMIFETKDSATKNEVFKKKIQLGGSEKTTTEFLEKNKTLFEDYEDFMKYCFEE